LARYAFLSDIHSNHDALYSVAEQIAGLKVFVLGDVVGYGAEPSKVLEWVRTSSTVTVQGNHDYAVGTGDTDWLNSSAAFAASWANRILSPEELAYLRGLPVKSKFELEGFRILMVHGSPDDPLHEYVFPQTHEALFDHYLEKSGVDIIALGHTHFPFFKNSRRGIVFNPGSVGQPRDGDPRSSYAVLDLGGRVPKVEHYRVAYDIERAASKIYAAGLPRPFGLRLFTGH
jgi:putative phosphoesterase